MALDGHRRPFSYDATMPTWAELVQAIRRAPDEDAPRLIAADWLMERRDPRGEYIALAVHRGALDAYAEQEAEWAQRLVKLGANNRLTFVHGFVEELHLDETKVANLPACWEVEPIRDVVLRYGKPKAIRALVHREELAQLRMLSLVDCKCSAELLRSPHLATLDEVQVYNHDEDIAGALAAGRIRPKRTEYNVDAIDREGLETLVASDYFARIEELHLARANDDVLATLCAKPMPHLRRLDISGDVGEDGFAALGHHLDQLAELRIEGPFDDAIAEIVISHVKSGRLRRLACTRPYETGITALVRSSAMRSVEHLTTSSSSLDVDVLKRSKHRGALRTVAINHVPPGFELDHVEIVTD